MVAREAGGPSHEPEGAAIEETRAAPRARHTRPETASDLAMRRGTLAMIASGVLAIGSAHAQSSGGIPTGAFGTGEAKARPEHVEEDLIGTPRDVRTLPRAPTLPDLTHRAPELSFEHTVASIAPHGQTDPTAARLTAHLAHFDFELPLIPSRLYAGAEWGFGAGRGPAAPDGAFVSGQPQVFARAVHSFSHERYSVGAGLGLSPPVFRYSDTSEAERLDEGETSLLLSVIRPWDLSMFLDRRFTARPWVDLRVALRHLVVQARLGLDVNLRTSETSCSPAAICDRAGQVQVVSLGTLFVGWQPRKELAFGIEAWEVYLLQTSLPVSDRERSTFALSPSVRFFYRWVEPAISVLFPVGAPLLNAVESYYAVRLDLRVWFDSR